MKILTNQRYCITLFKALLVLLVSVFFISSCGGAKSSAPVVLSAPTTPVNVTLSYDVNQINFSWDTTNGATSYQLLSQLTPTGEFVAIQEATISTTTSLTIPVHLHNWVTAQYKIRSCNSLGCIDTNAIAVKNQSANAIGYFKASNNNAGDEFGTAVALSGDGNTMAIAAPKEDSFNVSVLDDNSAIDSGMVYIYKKINNKWQFQQYIKPSLIQQGAEFGAALALDDTGATLIVGQHIGSSASLTGMAYIFELTNGQWSQIKSFSALKPLANDYFGFSVAISGDGNTVVVGAPGLNANLPTSRGELLVLKKINFTWQRSGTQISASDSNDYEYFGISVDVNYDGTRIISAKQFRASSVYVYDYKLLTGNTIETWVEQKISAELILSSTNDNSGFGIVSIDYSGDVIAFAQIGKQVQIFNNELDLVSNTKSWVNTLRYLSKNPGGVFGGGESFSALSIGTGAAVSISAIRGSVVLSGDGKSLLVGAASEATNKKGVFTGFSASGTQELNGFYGASYLFQATADNQWLEKRFIKSANTDTNDSFASAVAISNDGTSIAIGAIGESSDTIGIAVVNSENDNNFNSRSGAVYVF
ncbi:High-affnity carbon uptake protein Hat/HatR [hydrothermal vent metagenome]|uniref:High-affnity carbon uptake protein Hat/HatR n=1 Tax=hydrothermal vent metagenome TaxID=652676 RepID=A0A3B1ALR3_9ZZZZ